MTKAKQNTMQAAAIDRFGGIETITLRTLPVPEGGPDEVLIRVESAGVAVWDVFEREGGFAQMFGIEPKFPYVLGSDGAGTVAAVGEQVSRFKEGDRVYAAACGVCEGGGVHPVAFLEAADLLADSGDRARSVGAKHVGELRLDSEHLGESSLTLENVPNGHARRLDPDQDFVRPDLGHGQRSQRDRLDATEPVDGGGLHCVLFRLRHDFSPEDVLGSTA